MEEETTYNALLVVATVFLFLSFVIVQMKLYEYYKMFLLFNLG